MGTGTTVNAQLLTTANYAGAVGTEEKDIARRMWAVAATSVWELSPLPRVARSQGEKSKIFNASTRHVIAWVVCGRRRTTSAARQLPGCEQRPILNATGPLPLDLGAELLSDLGLGEFAAGINKRRDGGIAPQFHRKGQILGLPRPRHKARGPEFSVPVMTAAEDGPYGPPA